MIWWKRLHCAKNVRDTYVQGLVVDVRRKLKRLASKREFPDVPSIFFSIYKRW